MSQWPYFDSFIFLGAAANVRETTGNLVVQNHGRELRVDWNQWRKKTFSDWCTVIIKNSHH
jgi:hypothetical protein